MKQNLRLYLLAAIVGITCVGHSATITVQTDKPGAPINPAMWGIFFEDINLGADGGLYAELVKNRSFEFPNPTMGWRKSDSSGANGTLQIRDQDPFDADNPHYLRLESADASSSGAINEGFRGMGVHQGERYAFSTRVRAVEGSPTVKIQLIDSAGKVIGETEVNKLSAQWSKRTATLRAKETAAKGALRVLVEGKGVVDLDMVSLFPENTWKNRPGGLRADMVQLLADMKPGFLRFPGGCIVEGSELGRRYQWKTTIGPIEDRKLIINRWNYEFKHRPTPDYFQSFGLGFFEFFQLAEDIGAQSLPIINCGMACQFNTGQLVPLDQLDPYIQDALDLIEFANGPKESTWGAKRAAMGHPQPFNLKMMGVGNEQWGPQYIERYVAFAKVLKAKHPEIMLVSDAGPSPADDRFNFLWPKLQELHADIVDQHCYANPIWFLSNAHRYDNYDSNGPKIFMGEYAAQSIAIVSPDNKNDLECALAEAAYMTGLERNAAVVRMASYAPLFGHVEGWQWTPNLIWADNLRAYGTANYYVQQLFSVNRGDTVLPAKVEGVEMPVPEPAGRIGLGTFRTAVEFKDVQVARGGETLLQSDFAKDAQGWSGSGGKWVVEDGGYRQTDSRGTGRVFAGNDAWTDYTMSVKARKLGGSEGFMVMVRYRGPEDYVLWNVGANNNTSHVLIWHFAQQDHELARVNGSIDDDRAYDARVQLKGSKVECYLDGRLVESADVSTPRVERVYASATRDDKAREIIVKVVNPGNSATEATIDLNGLSAKQRDAEMILLTGSDGDLVNSFDKPRQVAPVQSKIKISGPRFTQNLPARSFTVLRIPNH